MERLQLTRAEYNSALDKIGTASENGAYLDQFAFAFPDGLNTASTLEICRAVQDPSLESKVHITKLCIAGKKVSVTCPNGETADFCIADAGDSVDGFDIFRKEPLALSALADTVYGHVLKKSLRLSAPRKAEPQA